MSGADRLPRAAAAGRSSRCPMRRRGRPTMVLRMGIDLAVRAPHQASLADERGVILWSGHRFRTTAAELDRLWARLPEAASEVTVVMEPSRNAWVALAAWFRRHGATVVLVPPER